MAVDVDDRTLYVGNLHKNVSEDLLYELFLQAGPVERVSIPNMNSKNFRYGFVTYHYECSIDYAIQLYKGTNLYKKELLIKRKGERNNADQQIASDRHSGESLPNSELTQDQLFNCGQPYMPHYVHQSIDNCNSGKANCHIPSLMHVSLKGHWSDRSRPYNRDVRRPKTSRSLDPREQRRDHLYNNADCKKSHRERKGRY